MSTHVNSPSASPLNAALHVILAKALGLSEGKLMTSANRVTLPEAKRTVEMGYGGRF